MLCTKIVVGGLVNKKSPYVLQRWFDEDEYVVGGWMGGWVVVRVVDCG